MDKMLKDINLITLPLAILLNDIANTNTETIPPKQFASRSKTVYRELLDGLQVYLFDDNLYMLNHYFEARDALKELQERISECIKILTCSVAESYEVKQIQNEGRLRQANHISSQLSDLIAFIQPDNLLKL